MSRKGIVNRKTKETDISMKLELDGRGIAKVDTGIGFFDHMLEGFSKHGFTCKLQKALVFKNS